MSNRTKPLVEVAVKGSNGTVPIDIMNVRQALDLPEHDGLKYHKAPRKVEYLNREELKVAFSGAALRKDQQRS